ncbi:hypothetical protein SEA_MRMIYAGI_109 [Mycobacterium phage MrMiyagi]|uniref:Uncharacterized protein n=1 Tax=Mycobacterium phage MrMiyagi TaxID=2762395 RepID=A0A7G8LQ00_9CAUD|nr:hypothetical protein SEA_MRMIYAGI_109 [Mycobacterium phage MrMiyagi]
MKDKKAYKVITADYGISTKVIGLLDLSTDEVAWIEEWVESRKNAPPWPYQLTVTKFDGFGTPNVFETYVYAMRYGSLVKNV